MTAQQKQTAFLNVCALVRAIENREKNARIQEQARATVATHYAELVALSETAGTGFSLLK